MPWLAAARRYEAALLGDNDDSMETQQDSTSKDSLNWLGGSLRRSEPLRVLLIEDNPGDADLVRMLLREVPGCYIELACASALETGLNAIHTSGLDAVIADLSLPDATPGETLLRLHQARRSLPVLVLSGSDTDELRRAARTAGVLEFLVKGEPETLALGHRLLEAVERYRSNEAQRQLERWISVVSDAVIVVCDEGQVQFANSKASAARALGEGVLDQNRITLTTRRCDADWVELTIEQGRKAGDRRSTRPPGAPAPSAQPSNPTLGLSICQRLIESYGGRVEVERQHESGAKVRIFLVCAEDSSPPSPPVARALRLGANRGRVLLIDDDTALTTAISRALRVQHEVLVAHSGQDALELLRRDACFDVVFCDVAMSGMSGTEVLQVLERDQPELAPRLVFLTGGACRSRDAELLARFANRKLDKPLNLEALMSLIRSAVGAAAQ